MPTDTPASADMTEQSTIKQILRKHLCTYRALDGLDHARITDASLDDAARALVSARAEGVRPGRCPTCGSQVPEFCGAVLGVLCRDNWHNVTPQAAETGGGQVNYSIMSEEFKTGPWEDVEKEDWYSPDDAKTGGGQVPEVPQSTSTGAPEHLAEDYGDMPQAWIESRRKRLSPDDADARGRELVASLITVMQSTELPQWVRGRAGWAHDWIEARLRYTPPPSEDDAKRRELAEWFDNAAEATLFFKLPYRNQWELYLSKAECQLVVSRLRSSKPSPDPLLAELRELFAAGGSTLVSWHCDHGSQLNWRRKALTDAQRAAIHSAMSRGGGSCPQSNEGPDHGSG